MARNVMTQADLEALPPAVDLVTAGRALGIGRTTAYKLAKSNAFPVKVLKLGNSYRVVTADLRRILGLEANHVSHDIAYLPTGH